MNKRHTGIFVFVAGLIVTLAWTSCKKDPDPNELPKSTWQVIFTDEFDTSRAEQMDHWTYAKLPYDSTFTGPNQYIPQGYFGDWCFSLGPLDTPMASGMACIFPVSFGLPDSLPAGTYQMTTWILCPGFSSCSLSLKLNSETDSVSHDTIVSPRTWTRFTLMQTLDQNGPIAASFLVGTPDTAADRRVLIDYVQLVRTK